MNTRTALAAFISCIGFAAPLWADFSGYYAFPDRPGYYVINPGSRSVAANTWTISSQNDGAFGGQAPPYVSVASTFLTLEGGGLFSGITHFSTVEVTNMAPAGGFLSFDFTLSLGTASVSSAYYLVNGMHFPLAAGVGSVTNVPLNAGDVFGIGVSIGPASIRNQLFPTAHLQVTNFSTPVPEPSTLALLAGGGAVVSVVGAVRCGRARSI